jgi:hypothetical protein
MSRPNLQRYQDIAEAVGNGKLKSGLQHYLAYGIMEGRDGASDPG